MEGQAFALKDKILFQNGVPAALRFGAGAQVLNGLKHLKFRGTDVIVFHVLDTAELTFPFSRTSRFIDTETGDEVVAAPAAVREDYLKKIGAAVAGYERELRLAGIDYVLTDTSRPLDFALLSYLSTRAKRG